MKYLWIYLVAAVVFLAIDALWLGYVARDFYKERLGDLLLARPRFGIAAGFYAIYVVGLIYFAIAPGLAAGSLWLAVFNGDLAANERHVSDDSLGMVVGYVDV